MSDHAVDGRPVGERTENCGRGDGLTAKLAAARDTAPDRFADDTLKIANVAWVAWESGRQVEAVWQEVDDEQ